MQLFVYDEESLFEYADFSVSDLEKSIDTNKQIG